MQRRLKIIAILFILVFPSSVYVFLTAGKEKSFVRIPYYGPKQAIRINDSGKVKTDTIYYHLPPFRFYNQEGKTVTSEQFTKKIWVASFTSFNGKDAPALAVTMNRIEERTNLDTGLRMVTFALDSESAKSMEDYAKMIHVGGKRRIFLSGNKEQLNQLATEGFYKAVDSSTAKGFIHFFLIDKEGCFRGIYNGLLIKDVDYLIDDISKLEANYIIQYEKKHKNEHDDDAI